MPAEVLDFDVELDENFEFSEPDFAHMVLNEQDVTAAYVFGLPVTALCGKVFIPTRDPDKFPVCPACKEAFFEKIMQ